MSWSNGSKNRASSSTVSRHNLTIQMFQMRAVDLVEAVGFTRVSLRLARVCFGVLPLARQDLDASIAATESYREVQAGEPSASGSLMAGGDPSACVLAKVVSRADPLECHVGWCAVVQRFVLREWEYLAHVVADLA